MGLVIVTVYIYKNTVGQSEGIPLMSVCITLLPPVMGDADVGHTGCLYTHNPTCFNYTVLLDFDKVI